MADEEPIEFGPIPGLHDPRGRRPAGRRLVPERVES